MPNLMQLEYIQALGEGKFGKVSLYRDKFNNQEYYVVKAFKNKNYKSNEFYSTPESEMENFNAFIEKTGIKVKEASVEDGKLILPYFIGRVPTQEEVRAYLPKLYEQGFVIADPKPDNFLCTEDYGMIPIDFGAVFHIFDENYLTNSLARNLTVNAPKAYPHAFEPHENDPLVIAYLDFGVALNADIEENYIDDYDYQCNDDNFEFAILGDDFIEKPSYTDHMEIALLEQEIENAKGNFGFWYTSEHPDDHNQEVEEYPNKLVK